MIFYSKKEHTYIPSMEITFVDIILPVSSKNCLYNDSENMWFSSDAHYNSISLDVICENHETSSNFNSLILFLIAGNFSAFFMYWPYIKDSNGNRM